jgi:nucleoside-diphosphate-sugar epimerase
MTDTVLVTGAGGFVGSAVVRLFVESLTDSSLKFSDGVAVKRLVALLRPGSSAERLQELSESTYWSIEYADLTDCAELQNLLTQVKPRAILHLAADKAIFRDLTELEQNRIILGPLETLVASLAGIPGARLIHTSSAWILPAGERLDESARLEPKCAYAKNKALADQWLATIHEQTGVRWLNLRLFNIFGKYEPATRLLPYLVSTLARGKVANLSTGDLIRDFSDVEDIAQAYRLALAAPDGACNTTYHIGSGRGTSLRDFAMAVATVTGNSNLIQFGVRQTEDQDLPCQIADSARARRILHWRPTADLELRIQRTARWWLNRWSANNGANPYQPIASHSFVTNDRKPLSP